MAAAQYRIVLMGALRMMTRRNVVRGLAASAAPFVLPCPSHAQSVARIVVIGGGFGGASCARAFRKIDPKLQVTLIEPNPTFTACPFSNEVIAGLREIEAQQFTYDRIVAEGVSVIAQAAVKVDPKTRIVGLADGQSLAYDRLVLAPGIDVRFDALPGYDEAAAARMPHAWKAGEQTLLLRRQIEAMDDGGLVVLAVPASPLRCPPGPYERASLIAHYLKIRKPRSKILILDAKDAIPQQRLFENAWIELYPGMIERVSLSQGGRVVSVDPWTNTIVTDFGNYTAQVANVIPPQKAGRIADIAGAADNTRHRRRLHWRRHPQISIRRECTRKGMRRCCGELDLGRTPGNTEAGRRLLQYGRARLCILAVRRLSAEGWHFRRDRRRRHQPGRRAARGSHAGSRKSAVLVQDNHGGSFWLGQPFMLLARGSPRRHSPCPVRPARKDCAHMLPSAMPFRKH